MGKMVKVRGEEKMMGVNLFEYKGKIKVGSPL